MSPTDAAVFRCPIERGAGIGAVVLLVPIPVVTIAGAWARNFDVASLAVLVAVGVLLGGAIRLVTRTAVVLVVSKAGIELGLTPLWRSRVPNNDILDVRVVTIDAYAQYGGWGIKGSTRSRGGRLYAVGGTNAVQVRTRTGRTYLAGFRDAAVARRAAQAIEDAG